MGHDTAKDTGQGGFGTPPDGALLAPLDERWRWLGDVEIVQSLPRSGMLLLPEGTAWPQLVVPAPDRLHARASHEHGRELRLDALTGDALAACWAPAWLAPGEAPVDGEALLLLHCRGLFRWVAGPPARAVERVLAGVLQGAAE